MFWIPENHPDPTGGFFRKEVSDISGLGEYLLAGLIKDLRILFSLGHKVAKTLKTNGIKWPETTAFRMFCLTSNFSRI